MASPGRINLEDLEKEVIITASRSSGPGGQNVNKVNTKVTVKFDIRNSLILNESQKSEINKKLRSKLTKEGQIIITSQDKRSQLQNKGDALRKLAAMLNKALIKKKKRKPTKPSKSAVEKRLKEKKKLGEKKKWRRGE